MVLWPVWENLFILLHRYSCRCSQNLRSFSQITSLLSFFFFFFTLNRRFKNVFISLPELQGWNPDFCKLKGKRRSAGKIGELEKLRVHFWTEGRKLVSVRVIGSFEISKVRESGIPVSKFLAPVRTGRRGFSRLKFFICILKNTNNCYEQFK